VNTWTGNDELEATEISLLLEGIYRHYGFDFREYAYTSLRRRIRQMMTIENIHSVSALQDKVLHDGDCMRRFLLAIAVNVTSMFRDPAFYVAVREKVVPYLRTYPTIDIWHAGCSTGEEVYSMAILLQEEGLLDRCRLYATDMNETVLASAKSGIFPLSVMREYTQNYQRAGGRKSFSSYYITDQANAIFDHSLKKNMVFGQHNLAMDANFKEFSLIMCRNVMIYFQRSLQMRVFELLHESLSVFGILALGNRESLTLSPHASSYEDLVGEMRLFRRVA